MRQKLDDAENSVTIELSTLKRFLFHKSAMAPKQPDFDATKTEHYRSYTVREHERKMYERVYKFVCIRSNSLVCPDYQTGLLWYQKQNERRQKRGYQLRPDQNKQTDN